MKHKYDLEHATLEELECYAAPMSERNLQNVRRLFGEKTAELSEMPETHENKQRRRDSAMFRAAPAFAAGVLVVFAMVAGVLLNGNSDGGYTVSPAASGNSDCVCGEIPWCELQDGVCIPFDPSAVTEPPTTVLACAICDCTPQSSYICDDCRQHAETIIVFPATEPPPISTQPTPTQAPPVCLIQPEIPIVPPPFMEEILERSGWEWAVFDESTSEPGGVHTYFEVRVRANGTVYNILVSHYNTTADADEVASGEVVPHRFRLENTIISVWGDFVDGEWQPNHVLVSYFEQHLGKATPPFTPIA
jgi:hypothetical protein